METVAWQIAWRDSGRRVTTFDDATWSDGRGRHSLLRPPNSLGHDAFHVHSTGSWGWPAAVCGCGVDTGGAPGRRWAITSESRAAGRSGWWLTSLAMEPTSGSS